MNFWQRCKSNWKDSFSVNVVRAIGHPKAQTNRKENQAETYNVGKNITQKGSYTLNYKIITILVKNIGKSLWVMGLGNDSLDLAPKSKSIKRKIDKLDLS